MGFRDREIERKFHTDSLSFQGMGLVLSHLLKKSPYVEGESTDHYWKISNDRNSFSRLREHEDHYEITIKKEDNGTYSDRIEIDLKLQPTSRDSVIAYQEIAFGPSVGYINKKYAVYFLGSKWDTVSFYEIKVKGKKIPGIFIEVEAKDIGTVDETANMLKSRVPGLKEVGTSLFNRYLRDEK